MSHEGNDKVIDRERDQLPYKWIVDIGHAWLQVSKREYELNGFQASTHSYQDETYVYLEEDVDATRYLNLYQPNPTEIPEVIYEGLCPVRQMPRISKPKKIQGWGGTPDHPFHYD